MATKSATTLATALLTIAAHLGNAVVPQVAEVVGRRLIMIDAAIRMGALT